LLAFDDVRARFEVTPIRGCPGRFIIHGAATRPPRSIAGDTAAARRYLERAPDPVLVVPLQGGGVISYDKGDGTYVHTLCDADGFARKLDQLGIPAAEPEPVPGG